jgi:hypothetical protein
MNYIYTVILLNPTDLRDNEGLTSVTTITAPHPETAVKAYQKVLAGNFEPFQPKDFELIAVIHGSTDFELTNDDL